MGLPAHQRRTGRRRPSGTAQHRTRHPQQSQAQSGTTSHRPELESVPQSAGRGHLGVRSIPRRHRVSEAALRSVLHRARHPRGSHRGRHDAPDRNLGRSTGPQPGHEPGRAGRGHQIPHHPRDAKFTAVFDEVFTSLAARIIKTPVRAPQANAIAERWVGTVRRECTDRLLIYGEGHLRGVLQSYGRHYNRYRPHRARDRRPPQPPHDPAPPSDLDQVRLQRRQVLDGLINQYRRAA